MASATDDEVLGRLADVEAIRDLARTYAHQVWRRSITGVVDVFTDDGRVELGTVPPVEGRAAITAAYEEVLGGADEFLPFVQQHLVDVDGDTATGTCYIQVWATIEGRRLIGAGYYDDRYRRTAGGWRISHRTVNMRPFIPVGPEGPEGSQAPEPTE